MVFDLLLSLALLEVGSEEVRRCVKAKQLARDGADKEA